ncbi:putative tetratricopeptide-like helical domain-containing protein [Rosa chinensis]|uniref:Putative tetratricopeptide-like helical domain-containing protein n=1 Tax=Rosa chinensis TaxID=74649 RepID=A0A2P6RMT4_ROSCH|nr:pentatricopeptide repeat-containing protein At5g66631 [Rosa chinensis]PRQ47735.1 putative tetratricopeptide-like helical domain-containing protein [Rosa chinensis]
MHFKHLSRGLNLIKTLTHHQTRPYARHPFPNKLSHYLYRAKLIDSIRLKLRSSAPNSLAHLANDRLLDSFVVTQALRSAPSADSALLLNETLESNPDFMHTQNTVHALATVLAKSGRAGELKYLIEAVNAGRFRNVRLSFMNLMQWQAAVGDVEAVLQVWEEYRGSEKRVCAESYNIVMRVYVQMGKDCEAVRVFSRMIEEGALPNCRTYTVMIEHMVNCGKWRSAMEVFKVLPFMRVKRTLSQYLLLVEACVVAKKFEEVKALLEEMRVDGLLPGRAMRLSLEQIQEAGFIEETEEFLREMLPNEGIKSIGYCDDSCDDEEDRDDEDAAADDDDHAGEGKEPSGVQLKPWLDPRSLANALQSWSPDEVSALEEAKFVWTTRLVCKILRSFKSAETAWKFFCWVACQPGFTHDIYTVQRMMTLLARHGHAELVDKLLSKLRMEQMRLPFSTIRLIIDFYGISKNADAALKVFHNDRNLCGPISNFNLMLLYSSLLRTLTKCGRDSDALDVLEEMSLSGICPDIQTFSGLMHHFALNGDIKTVQKLFAMVRQSGVQPDAYMFKVLIQAYCKCERAALAWRAFEDLRNLNLLPDAATKELLVKSLWKEGKRREAAAVEESCEETSDVLPLTLRGHIWTVSSADLSKVFSIYSSSFTSAGK